MRKAWHFGPAPQSDHPGIWSYQFAASFPARLLGVCILGHSFSSLHISTLRSCSSRELAESKPPMDTSEPQTKQKAMVVTVVFALPFRGKI